MSSAPAAMTTHECLSAPPGLAHSDPESSTASRERRRFALAAREITAALRAEFKHFVVGLERKIDNLATRIIDAKSPSTVCDLGTRIHRLETLFAISPTTGCSVDEVLELLERNKKYGEKQRCESVEHGSSRVLESLLHMTRPYCHMFLRFHTGAGMPSCARPKELQEGTPLKRNRTMVRIPSSSCISTFLGHGKLR